MSTPSNRPHLSVDIRRKEVQRADGPLTVLDGLRFEVKRDEFVTVFGPSGCGKTTLLRIISGLDLEYDGSVTLNGVEVRGPGRDRGVVFQDPRLLPWLRVAGNVAFGLTSGLSKAERAEKVDAALDIVSLANHGRLWPSQLSGGMAKRVALARTLVASPDLFLLDEPFTGLDAPAKQALHDDASHLLRRTTVLVTHDLEEAVYLSDRLLVLPAVRARIIAEITIPLSRPRDRGSERFRKTCAQTMEAVLRLWADAAQG